jgi:hypothetical protein
MVGADGFQEPGSPGAPACRHTSGPPRRATRPAWSGPVPGHGIRRPRRPLAAEGVEGGDGAAPVRRQEAEAVIEAGAAGGGFVLAVGVAIGVGVQVHSMPALQRHCRRSGPGRRDLPGTGRARGSCSASLSIASLGRWANMSPRLSCNCARMRSPPRMIRRISRPMRPFSAMPRGRRPASMRRARSIWPFMNCCQRASPGPRRSGAR